MGVGGGGGRRGVWVLGVWRYMGRQVSAGQEMARHGQVSVIPARSCLEPWSWFRPTLASVKNLSPS